MHSMHACTKVSGTWYLVPQVAYSRYPGTWYWYLVLTTDSTWCYQYTRILVTAPGTSGTRVPQITATWYLVTGRLTCFVPFLRNTGRSYVVLPRLCIPVSTWYQVTRYLDRTPVDSSSKAMEYKCVPFPKIRVQIWIKSPGSAVVELRFAVGGTSGG